jgi:outer membrane protein TolC
MKMKKILIGISLILFCANLLGAEKISIDEALQLAYENNYEYRNIKIDRLNMELQLKESYKTAMPRIDYRGSYSTVESGRQSLPTASGPMEDQLFKNEIGLVQPLYQGGIVAAGIKMSKMAIEMADYRIKKSKSLVKLDTMDKYLRVLDEKEKIKVYENSLNEVTMSYKKAKRSYDLGLISTSDYLPLKTQVISTKTSLIEAKNQYKINLIELKNAVGLPSREEIELLDIPYTRYNINNIDVDSDVDYAKANNMDSIISRLGTDITKEQEKLARADLLPTVNARFSYNSEDEHVKRSMDDWYWKAGIDINWTLFSFGKSFDKYNRAKNETLKAENKHSKSLDDLEVKIRKNYINLVKLNGTLETTTAELRATEENFLSQKKKYNEGLISLTDYLIYESQLSNSKLNVIQTRLNYYLAYEKYMEDLK